MCISSQSIAIINNKQQIDPTTTKVSLFHIFFTHQKGQKINQFSYYKSIFALSPDTNNVILLLDRHRTIAFNQIYEKQQTQCRTPEIQRTNLIEGNVPESVKQQDEDAFVRG
jgi:hypothetical protein